MQFYFQAAGYSYTLQSINGQYGGQVSQSPRRTYRDDCPSSKQGFHETGHLFDQNLKLIKKSQDL